MARRSLQLSLYWCSTDDHSEDWFVVAPTARGARRFVAGAEGFEIGEVDAERVAAVPAGVHEGEPPGWPSPEVITACGGTFLRTRSPRVVVFGDRQYAEGLFDALIEQLIDDQFEVRGHGRPNGSPRRERPQ